MANTFFDFDTSLNQDLDLKNEPLLPEDDDDCFENEEEYDALNDETFGTLDDGDWEQQHEQFAEFNEHSKQTEHIEHNLSQFLLEDSSSDSEIETITVPRDASVWTYTPQPKNGDVFNTNVLSSLQKASKSFIQSQTVSSKQLNSSVPLISPSVPPRKICTVEELEKNLIKNAIEGQHQQQSNISAPFLNTQQIPPLMQNAVMPPSQQVPQMPHGGMPRPAMGPNQRPPLLPPPGHSFHPMMQHPNARLPPPGLGPMNMPPPGLRHMGPSMGHLPHPMLNPAMMRMGPPNPHMMQHNGPPRHPGFMPYMNQHGPHIPPHPGYNFPPPPHLMQSQIQQQQQNNQQQKSAHNHLQQQQNIAPQPQNSGHSNSIHQQPQRQRHDSGDHQYRQRHDSGDHYRQRHDSGNYGRNRRDSESYRNGHRDSESDPNRDEYAGLMTNRDKQWLLNIQLLQLNTGTPYFDDYYYTIFKEKKLKSKENQAQNNNRFQNNGRQRRNSERQENTLTPKIYTPLQFENSLGKLQCGSVTAPRKIIDMDIVTPDKDLDSPAPQKDSKKTKQLLLELETLYSLLLKAEDIKNPMYMTNMEKLRELKQKQRLRELEQATTSEQKQEILKMLKADSEIVYECQTIYLEKIVQGLLHEDKFCSFLIIRKGKMLLLRLLPHLSMEFGASYILDLWSKLLLSLPVIGRRDTMGDNILPKFYPLFKRYVQNAIMSEISDLVSGLVEVVKPDLNARSTPLSHVGKAPLYFVVLNKFGVSALVLLLIRAELLFSSQAVTEKHQHVWVNFLNSWASQTETAIKVAVPMEAIPTQIFNKHMNRFPHLTLEKKSSLEKYFTDLTLT